MATQKQNYVGFDRRVLRSEDRADALELLLSKFARVSRCQEMVLADLNGLVVGGVGSRDRVRLLAAYAPLLHTIPEQSSLPPEFENNDILMRSLQVGPSELFLIGSSGGMAERAELPTVVAGIERILSVN